MLILCNGMPRSGSTLQYNIVRRLIEIASLGRGRGYFSEHEMMDKKRKFLSWAVHPGLHLIKSHDCLPYSEEVPAGGKIKILYIYRDVRDVAVSLHKKFGQSYDMEMVRFLDRCVEIHHRITRTAGPDTLVQQYETVIADLFAAVRVIAGFLQLPVSEPVLREVAADMDLKRALEPDGLSLWKIKVKRTALHFSRKHRINRLYRLVKVSESRKDRIRNFFVHGGSDLMHDRHVSDTKGSVGVWKHMLPRDFTDILHGRYSEWLVRHRYSVP